jgi:hypothetical protein
MQTQAVVRRIGQVLPGPKVPFRCLNGSVTEEQLNLLQIPASGHAV